MRILALTACVAATSLATPVAVAGDNDLVLSRLGNEIGTGEDAAAIGDNDDFRALTSELGVVLAPRLLSPSDTLGFGGFQFSGDLGFTTISNDKDYWRVRESSAAPMGGGSHGSSLMPTLGMFMRKGIWLPLPSFEIGAGVVHLLDSDIFAAQLYSKFALHEGYHDFPLPSVAVRGSVSRMMGTPQLDLTVASIDVSLSKQFGISNTLTLEPYGGWNLLFIVPRSEVVDRTPNEREDPRQNFVFSDQDNITRHRGFVGLKLQYYVFAVIAEFDYALKGSSVDNRAGTDADCAMVGDTTTVCDSTDQAGAQQTFTVAIGLDF